MHYLLKSVQYCHLHRYPKMTREGAGLIVHSAWLVVTRLPTIPKPLKPQVLNLTTVKPIIMEKWYVAMLLCVSAQIFLAVQADTHTQTGAEMLKELFMPPASVSVTPTIDIVCMLELCTKQSISCLLASNCRNAVKCAQQCMADWDSDKTLEKFHVQNCTNKCAFTFADDTYAKFVGCFSDYQCIGFPPIKNTCRAPNVHPIKQLSIKDMQGSWWVVKGYHPVYDCYPCQRLYLTPYNASFWNYTPVYQVYLTNDSLELVTQHMTIPTSPAGKNISFVYHDVGLVHYETWWLIDKAEDGSYLQMYYCGHTLQWNYEGALVLARNRTLDDGAYASIASSYQKAVGLDFSQFCNTSTSTSCPDWKTM